MSIAPSSPFDVAAQISAGVQRMTIPPIPPINPSTLPDVPPPPTSSPPGVTPFCKTLPPALQKLFCPAYQTPAEQQGGTMYESGATGKGSVCNIPLIGNYACDLGQRTAFVVLAILLIAVGAYVLIGGGTTRVDISQVTKAAKAVAA